MRYDDIVLKWQNKKISTIEDVDEALHNFRILFAYNSNAIENPETTIHDTREIFENGKVIQFTGDLRTLFEIENQKNCYEWIKMHVVNKTPLSKEFVLETHKKLMRGCYDESRYKKGERAGAFKIGDYITGDGIGALSEEVPQLIEELCNEMNGHKGDILVGASYFHLMFENIHPFADGNGRVGRTLMNYYLMINDYPPTIIYNEDKKTYYMALSVFDKTGKIDGFTEFLKEESMKTWEEPKTQKKEISLKEIPIEKTGRKENDNLEERLTKNKGHNLKE